MIHVIIGDSVFVYQTGCRELWRGVTPLFIYLFYFIHTQWYIHILILTYYKVYDIIIRHVTIIIW